MLNTLIALTRPLSMVRFLAMAAALSMTACGTEGRVDVWQQAAATDYKANPKRIFMFGTPDPTFQLAFAQAARPCGIDVAAWSQPGAARTDDPEVRRALTAFRADAVLSVRQEPRAPSAQPNLEHDSRTVTLIDLKQTREAWKGVVTEMPRDQARFAAEISMFLRMGRVLKNCQLEPGERATGPLVDGVIELIDGRPHPVR